MADSAIHGSFGTETFTSVPLDAEAAVGADKKKKKPKRILHFSDGILEEYSSSSEDEDAKKDVGPLVDPKTLKWAPWCFYYASTAARKALGVADVCGEKLAWFFGITTPKYRYEIEEYKRAQKELEEDMEQERRQEEKAQGLSTIDVQVVDSCKTSTTTIASNNNSMTEPPELLEKY
ncbi:protein FAM177A1 [Aplysia californica]|uniref:Protein FAM177A1 n=1 Tax=Aplysia californica TaxID=6500 RepID=A0ABM0JLA9_APLCA|nr:protein FAM177A1 [Aplysia californica]